MTATNAAAKEYLARIQAAAGDDHDDRRGVTGGSDEEEGAELDEDGVPKTMAKDRLSELLKQDAGKWFLVCE